ncbi:MAG: UpxY family transcription antiterminator [Gemmatimonadota bacterium]
MAADQAVRWYACYTRSRHEKRVAAALEEAGQDVFLPMYPKISQWHDRTRTVYWALFPGYLFVQCVPGDLTDVVLRVPGAVSIVSLGGKPVPIPDSEIASVQRFAAVLAETGEIPQAEPLVEEGWRVRVAEGPLAGVEGVVLEKRGRARALVQVGVRAIGQGLKVELDAAVLETIEKSGSEDSAPGE